MKIERSRRIFFSKPFVGIISGLIILITGFIFVNNLAQLSVPDDYESFSTSKIKEDVKVYFNSFGIPHIIASNTDDIFYSIGYLHARDRLFQMDLLRRTGKGKLSEILGKETIALDKFFKSLSFEEIAQKSISKLSKQSRNALNIYAQGINDYIRDNTQNYPFEFSALGYTPDFWTPIDCLILNNLMAFDMSPAFINDICLAEISEKVGVRKALSMVSGYPNDAPCITDKDFNPKKIYKFKLDTFKITNNTDSSIISGVYEKIIDIFQRYALLNTGGGSNSWVVKKSASNSNVILANDPHLKLMIPSYWYQMHVSCPDFNVIGLTIPGAPFFLIGRNDRISWGITVMMLDDCDFFIERIDESNNKYYLTPTGKNKFRYRADTILVKNQDPIFYYTRFTDRSAVISDNYLMKEPRYLLELEKDSTDDFAFYDKFILTYDWTGSRPSRNFDALYKLYFAKNYTDFSKALNKWSAPGLNWTYADLNGNMGIKPAGIVPVRPNTNPLIPNPGWLGSYQWNGFIKAEELPSIYNPPKRFVASSNNKTSRNVSYFISDYFEPPSRIRRIENIIKDRQEFNARNVQIMQLDNLSLYTDEMLFYIIPILAKNNNKLDMTAQKALELLTKWDRIFSPAYAAPSIWNAFYKNLNYNTFYDELGERLFRTYNYISQFSHLKLLDMLKTNDNFWFNNINTKKKENMEDIIVKSFKDAVEELTERFKSKNVYSWKLKRLVKLELKHPFSDNDFLKNSVSGGVYQVPGSFTSINKADWHVYQDYKVAIGSSARFVADMQDSVIYYSILGGASGDPQNPHYKDQAMFFINGGYIKSSISPIPEKNSELKLEIFPD